MDSLNWNKSNSVFGFQFRAKKYLVNKLTVDWWCNVDDMGETPRTPFITRIMFVHLAWPKMTRWQRNLGKKLILITFLVKLCSSSSMTVGVKSWVYRTFSKPWCLSYNSSCSTKLDDNNKRCEISNLSKTLSPRLFSITDEYGSRHLDP